MNELTTLIVSEIRRRKCTGVVYIVEENEVEAHFASCHDDPVPLSPPRQLAKFALHCNELTVQRYDPDDDILSDNTPWRTQ